MPVPFSLERNELKVFLMFFLLFTFFISWGGTNSWSRYDLTKSISEDQSFDISEYSSNTFDKVAEVELFHQARDEASIQWVNQTEYVKLNRTEQLGLRNEYIELVFENPERGVYSDKAPLSSFLAVPAYKTGDFLAEFSDHGRGLWIDKAVVDMPVRISFETALEQFLIVLTVSVLSGALIMLLGYRYLKEHVEEEIALYTTFVFGLSTPVLIYSTKFFGVMAANFFGFTSFIALQKSLENESWIYIAGLLSALAFSTEYYAAIIPAVLTFYLFAIGRKSSIPRFVAGAFLGSIPLFIYHWTVTGNPFFPVLFSKNFTGPGPIGITCSLYAACKSSVVVLAGFVPDPVRIINTLFRLLFYPTRGIFFYSPVLLLSIPGVYELYKKDWKILLISPGIFLAFLFFQASRLNWLAGASFGPRYAILGLPFLFLPVALGLKKMSEKGKLMQIFLLLVFLFSAFNMLLGFNSWQTTDIDRDMYNERFNSFSAIQPEIYSTQVDKFKTYGPRSEILMSLSDRYKGFETSYRSPYGPKWLEFGSAYNRGLLFSTNLVPIILVLAALTGLLGSEIRLLRILGPLLILLLSIASISVSDAYVSGEYYRIDQDAFESVNGSLATVFYVNESSIPYVEVRDRQNGTSLKATVNGQFSGEYQIQGSEKIYFPSARQGRNEIRLESKDCKVPASNSDSSDIRCISFSLKEMGFKSVNSFETLKFLQGWHEREKMGRWMKDQSKMFFQVNETFSKLELEFKTYKALDREEFLISVNGDVVREFTLEEKKSLEVPLKTRKGINTLEIRSRAGCKKPSEVENTSDDNRCLSLMLQDFKVSEFTDVFKEGWYAEETADGNETFRWMSDQSKIVFPSRNGQSVVKLELKPYSDPSSQNIGLMVLVNGELDSFILTPGDRVFDRYLELETDSGLNSLELVSLNGCKVPTERGLNPRDERCLSFQLRDFGVISN